MLMAAHPSQAWGQLGIRRSPDGGCLSLPSKQVWNQNLSLLLSTDHTLPLPGLLGTHSHMKSKFSIICVNEEEESGKWET